MILWTILAVFFGTAVIAARFASPTRLTALLPEKNVESRVDAFFKNQDAEAFFGQDLG